MSITTPDWKSIAAAICLIVTFSVPAAGQTADETDESALLEQLAAADRIESMRISRQLDALWSKSGSAAIDLLLKRGKDALEAQEIASAIEHLTALTDHAPDFAEGWHLRASAYFAADLYGPAMADLERALTLNPNNYNALFGLGSILEIFGDKKRAYEAYLKVQAIHPHHEQVAKALERLESEIHGMSL